MAWRFRKLFTRGPFRWSLSKKGVGFSWGIPGLRFGVSPTGQRYVSFGIPNTGFYYIKYFKNQPINYGAIFTRPLNLVRSVLPKTPGKILLIVIACLILSTAYTAVRKSFVEDYNSVANSQSADRDLIPQRTEVDEQQVEKLEPLQKSTEEIKKSVAEAKKISTQPTSFRSIEQLRDAPLQATTPAQKREYYTIGSSQSEVLAIQGTPTSISYNTYRYGLSSISFDNNKNVASYNNFSGNLKIKLYAEQTSGLPYFTLGSDINDVIAIQGTPTQVGYNTIHYGLSTISYDNNGKVTSYNNFANNLKIQMYEKNTSGLDYYTLGSDYSDVLAIQGTPSKIGYNTIHYGLSTITFSSGKLSSYNNFSRNLRIKIPTSTYNPNGYFTIGSTFDEVIAVQGTPTQISYGTIHYGLSTISFDNNQRVVRFNNFSKNLRVQMS